MSSRALTSSPPTVGSRVDPSPAATVATLVVGDACAAAISILVAGAVVSWLGQPFGVEQVVFLLLFVLLSPIAYAVVGLYPGIGVSEVDELRLLTLSSTGVWGAMLPVLALLRGPAEILPGALAWLASLLLMPIVRTAVRGTASKAQWWGVPVVLLGAGQAGTAIAGFLQSNRRAGLRRIAALDDDPALLGRSLHGVPVTGALAESERYAANGVRHAVLAMPSIEPRSLYSVVRTHARRFPSLIIVPDVEGLGSVGSSVCSFEGLVGVRVRQNLLIRHNLLIKRCLDVVMLIPAIVFALPIIGIVALIILGVSPGNPFYAQERVGLRGKKFKLWKLRTMYRDAEARLARQLEEDEQARMEWNSKFKLTYDKRVLPGIGKLLRMSSLDELPQLWNIMRGEMSFVGPRPFPSYHLEAFDEDFRSLREEVIPGLTGLWQTTARAESDLAVQERLDSIYIVNWSLWMDLYLLARTPLAVMRARGAY